MMFTRHGHRFALHAVYCSSLVARQPWFGTSDQAMANQGDVYSTKGEFFAKIEAQEDGVRFHMKGPRRDTNHLAVQDLTEIRAAASGEATRLGELLSLIHI